MDLWFAEEQIERVDQLLEQWQEEIGNIDHKAMRSEMLIASLQQCEDNTSYINMNIMDESCWSDCSDDDQSSVYSYDGEECDSPISTLSASSCYSFFDEEEQDESIEAFDECNFGGLLGDFEAIHEEESDTEETASECTIITCNTNNNNNEQSQCTITTCNINKLKGTFIEIILSSFDNIQTTNRMWHLILFTFNE